MSKTSLVFSGKENIFARTLSNFQEIKAKFSDVFNIRQFCFNLLKMVQLSCIDVWGVINVKSHGIGHFMSRKGKRLSSPRYIPKPASVLDFSKIGKAKVAYTWDIVLICTGNNFFVKPYRVVKSFYTS